MAKVRAKMTSVDTRRPKLRDVVKQLIRVKGTAWASEKAFFDAWGAARRLVYRTYEWERFRVKVFQRSKWVCESCKRKTAKEIHHRRRVYDEPALICTLSNVLHVCEDCHKAAHHGAYG